MSSLGLLMGLISFLASEGVGVTQQWLGGPHLGPFCGSQGWFTFSQGPCWPHVTLDGFVQLPSQTSKGTACLPLVCWVWK